MLKQTLVQAVGFVLAAMVGLSAIRGDVPKGIYLPALGVLCTFLVVGWLLALQKVRTPPRDKMRIAHFVQHTTFVVMLLALSGVCAELVIADQRPPIDEGTLSVWLFLGAFAIYVITLLTLAIWKAFNDLQPQDGQSS